MANQGRRLCDACHKREATCHLVEVVDGRKTSTDLCKECFEGREPLELKQSRKAVEATHCEYCGGRPCVDWHCLTNIFALMVGPEEPRFLCPRCSAEYNHFLEHALQDVPDGLPESAQLARFQTLRAEAHEYMLKWVGIHE